MDRFTWGVVIGAIALCTLAVGSVFFVRSAPPPSLKTPAGVVTAFVQAVRDRDSDRALGLLATDAIVGSAPPVVGTTSMQDTFRRQMADLVQDNSTARAIHILNTTETGEKARVTVEVSTATGGLSLFGGEYRRTLIFGLTQVDGMWKIESSPSLYEIG